MQYSEKELRWADLLALILIGFGLAVVPLGVLVGRAYWIPCGGVLVCLGAALELKIRRIIRNAGREDETPDT
jgi:hypothetical protein